MQTERFDMARSQSAKARESRNLLSIALFVLIPPSRGQEIRTLRIAPSGDREHVQGLNSLVLNSDGTLMFRFEDYKTYGSHGVDVTNLPEDHRLNVIIREYLDKYRDILLDAADDGTTNNFLLLVSYDFSFQLYFFKGLTDLLGTSDCWIEP
ncbi:uncharacterized protein LOC125572358 [Nematostella vectensis]|uniref:uncharacterized protein LOC125572358 n=1 Tax=Nematostella vectensis TaxID=45351 RepID=UPI0020773D03|nr:uncharacterized protein LOC125572358 [Nematostella vectensis]XP_048588759.1 uncharacterized protein LOC125572358 [Nematostella vectensis]